MPWLSDNYKWLFDGVGGAAAVAFALYLAQRLFGSRTKGTRKEKDATLTAQGSKVVGSPVASGFHNVQTVNAPTIHANTVNFGGISSPLVLNRELLATPSRAATPLPDIQYRGAEPVSLHEESLGGLAERDLTPNALIIRFANEPRPGVKNLSARVRAVLIYRYEGKEVDLAGSWLYENSDVSEFEPDSRRHKLIAGILLDGQFAAIASERFVAHRRNWSRSDAYPLKGFRGGTLFVQLTNVQTQEILYQDTFVLSLTPLSISLQSVYEQQAQVQKQGNLEFVFGGDKKPYLEEQPTGVMPGGVLCDRRYRVGIRNRGSVVVPKVRVVLENCEPSEHHGIHLNHALHFMDTPPGTSEFSVVPGDEPSAFVDVVYDETLGGKLRDNAFGICYASPVRSFAIPRGPYILTLRVEGDGTVSLKKFRIYQDPSSGMLTMREVD